MLDQYKIDIVLQKHEYMLSENEMYLITTVQWKDEDDKDGNWFLLCIPAHLKKPSPQVPTI